MDPKIWGRSMWYSLINIVKGAPETLTAKQRRSYELFFTALGDVLPCDKCKINYRKHIVELPPVVDTRKHMLEWLHTMHNKVLQQLKKDPISLEAFVDKYDQDDNLFNNIICIIFLIGIVAGLYYLYKKYNY